MKSCYGGLKVPNVPKTHSWMPDKVKSLSHAGDLYVGAFKPLVINAHNEPENTGEIPDEIKSQVSNTIFHTFVQLIVNKGKELVFLGKLSATDECR